MLIIRALPGLNLAERTTLSYPRDDRVKPDSTLAMSRPPMLGRGPAVREDLIAGAVKKYE